MIAKVERSNTRDKKRCRYKVSLKDGSLILDLGQDKYLWNKFMAGQVKIYCETWFDIPSATRQFGKIVEGENW